MSGLTTTTSYTTDVVSTNEVKSALRIPDSDSTHNTLIGTCRDVATKVVMEMLQRTLTKETLKLGLDAYPYGYGSADDSLPYTEGITVGPYMNRIGSKPPTSANALRSNKERQHTTHDVSNVAGL